MPYKKIDCKKASDFLNQLTPWNSPFELSDFVFRGHSNDDYLLLPNSFRDRTHNNIKPIARIELSQEYKYYNEAKILGYGNLASQHAAFEFHMLRRFYRKANINGLYVPRSKFMSHAMERDFVSLIPLLRLYKYETWLDRDFVEIAALAQHYGLPTRLIDWTYNPYTAAFFASNNSKVKKGGKISFWMMNVKSLADILDSNSSDVKLYNPHYQWNDNAKSQSGLFTYKTITINKDSRALEIDLYESIRSNGKIPTDEKYKKILTDYETLDESVERLVNESNALKKESIEIEDVLVKITLPHTEVDSLNRLLRKINISEGSIFPGYDGVVRDILNKNSLR